MPEQSSAAKRHRQSLNRRERNRSVRSSVRTANKRFIEAVSAKNIEEARERLYKFTKLIDTAAGKGIYTKNTAARKKSRMQKLFNSLEQ
ncbi:MAG: 30S ribosomal protein S20 [Spirochaetales bacterium]|nr:30S ribosomal protein S20 [Spirochaetales bacterium]